jgi:hypothetical protein
MNKIKFFLRRLFGFRDYEEYDYVTSEKYSFGTLRKTTNRKMSNLYIVREDMNKNKVAYCISTDFCSNVEELMKLLDNSVIDKNFYLLYSGEKVLKYDVLYSNLIIRPQTKESRYTVKRVLDSYRYPKGGNNDGAIA